MAKPREDLTGKRFGRLTAIKYVGNSCWECKCDCGNVTKVKTSNLKNSHTKSCGCIAKEQSALNGQKSLMDLTGQRFGKLVVQKRVKKGNKYVWQCKCDCGNICYVPQNNLCRKVEATKSCGCNISLDEANKSNIVQGTNVGNIKRKEALSNSSLGIKGVYYSKTQGLYVATIGFQGKQYHLKSSTNLQECINARQKAEQEIFGNFLEWYNKEYKKQNPPEQD